jgi:hypothetical protein
MNIALRINYIQTSMKAFTAAIYKYGDEINHCQQINEGGNYDGYISDLIRLEQAQVDKYDKLKEELFSLASTLA